jgi:O-antigen ligase
MDSNLKISNITSKKILNFLFFFFPFCFIFGNLLININIVLFCCIGIFNLKKNNLKIELNLPLKIFFLFFFAVFFSTILSFIKSIYFSTYEHYDLVKLLKSIGFFRFYFLLLLIFILNKYNVLNFKYFFISSALFSIVLSLDIIFQYYVGFDLIGFKSFGVYNSGFFGDELVAGSFITKFSIFSIFLISFIFKNKKFLKLTFIILAVCILGLGTLLSGNRMPVILFLFGLFLIFFFKNNIKKTILFSILPLSIVFSFVSSFDRDVEMQFLRFHGNSKIILTKFLNSTINKNSQIIYQKVSKPNQKYEGFPQNFFSRHSGSTHNPMFKAAIDVWKKNKILGNGIKSFRKDCKKIPLHTGRLCSNHPHNYYIEILLETGIVGFLFFLAILTIFAVFIFRNFKLLNESSLGNLILLTSTITLIIEIFPIKSTGSIFSTGNATYLILISSIIISYKKILNGKKEK